MLEFCFPFYPSPKKWQTKYFYYEIQFSWSNQFSNKMSSKIQTVNILGECRAVLYGCGEENDKKNNWNYHKTLYKLIQNMDTSINDRLNTMNQSVEAKKKNRQCHTKIRGVRTNYWNITPNQCRWRRLNNFDKTCAEFRWYKQCVWRNEREREGNKRKTTGALKKN